MSASLWTAMEVAQATGAALIDGADWQAGGISIDTRTLQQGDLFVALHAQRDGHDFIGQAYEAGAVAALVDQRVGSGPQALVDDTLQGLARMAAFARDRAAACRVAVTGSVGKSSVKEAVATILAAAGPAHASEKSYNNQWGVPLSLARMPSHTKRAVFELGMNHAGEIAPLAALVRPHVGLITALAPAHIEALGSMDAIAEEKAQIWSAMGQNGVAVIPADDPQAGQLAALARQYRVKRIISFGRDREADIRIRAFETGPGGSAGELDIFGDRHDFVLKCSGAHWAANAAAAVAAALFCGVEAADAVSALADLTPLPGRGGAMVVQLAQGEATVIDDSYNANPVSMAAALNTLSTWPGRRRVAVLGDMLELGQGARRFHEALAWDIEQAGIDQVYCAGPLMRYLHQSLPGQRRGGWFESVDDMRKALGKTMQAGDVILLKGSNGSCIHKIAAALRTESLGGEA